MAVSSSEADGKVAEEGRRGGLPLATSHWWRASCLIPTFAWKVASKKKSNEFSCPRNFGFSFSCWRNETTFWPVNWSFLKDAKVAANLHR